MPGSGCESSEQASRKSQGLSLSGVVVRKKKKEVHPIYLYIFFALQSCSANLPFNRYTLFLSVLLLVADVPCSLSVRSSESKRSRGKKNQYYFFLLFSYSSTACLSVHPLSVSRFAVQRDMSTAAVGDRKIRQTRQVSSMILLARPTVPLVVITIFIGKLFCFARF